MTTLRAAAQAALELLDLYTDPTDDKWGTDDAVFSARDTLRTALAEPEAQPEPEPVAWRMRNTAFRSEVYEYFKTKQDAEQRQKSFNMSCDDGGLYGLTPLYAHPPRSYEPLTFPEIHEFDWPEAATFEEILLFTRAVEAEVLRRLGVEAGE